MGCLCFKASDIHEEQVAPRQRAISHSLTRQTVVPVRREESVVTNSIAVSNGGFVLAEKQAGRVVRTNSEEANRKAEKTNHSGRHVSHHAGSLTDLHPRDTIIPRSTEGEQVAAGWPPWLAAVAGEAIKGWIPRRADSFEKLNKVSVFSSAFWRRIPAGIFWYNLTLCCHFIWSIHLQQRSVRLI